MSDPKFDPYYKWLGISPADQPANHYRLLGVDQFESDADVIESAAQRQIAHVRTFALGNYAEASQALLNELSSARVTLLNPDRKKEYDKRLKAELQSNVPSIDQGSGESRQQRALVEVAIEPVPGRKSVSSRRVSVSSRKKKVPLGVIGLVVVILGLVLTFLLYRSFSGGDNRVAVTNEKVSSEATAKQGIAAEKESPPDRKKLPANENTLGNAIASGASTQSSTQEKSAGLAPVASVYPEPSESTRIASTGTPEPSGSDAAAVMSGVVGDPPPPAIAPFDSATAQKHQEAWAKHLGVPVEVTNAIGMTFVLIPPGEFQMGVSETLAKTKGTETQWYGNSQPAHRVRITKPFYMSRYEVTQKQFRGVVGGGLTPVTGDGTRYPATQIGWTACVKFCDRLTEQGSGIPKGGKVRLPTEAEWEFACRAGTVGWFWMGDAIGPAEASLRNAGRKMRLEPIDAFTPNPFGLFNIHGNVMEWCSDWLSADYYGTSPVEDPQGPPNGTIRVHRGGGYSQPPFAANSYWRHGHKSDTRSGSIGFRPIVELSVTSNQPSAGTGAGNVKAGNALELRDEDRSSQGLEEPSGKQNSAQLQPALSGQKNTPQAALAPFDATTAKEHQEAWAKYLGVTVETENSIGMKLRVIPAGTFTMGEGDDTIGEGDEAHEVTLTKPLLLGIHEVTQKQYERVMEINPSKFNQSSSNPVDQVIWNDAVEFCRRLSALPQEKQAGRVYRLPTEAEWEYACRAGTTTHFSFGEDESQLSDYAWFKGNMSFGTHPVGEKKPNPWGLYDMHGNVYEWCNDWFADYPSGSATDPAGPQQGYNRVLRGGGWSYAAELCRSAVRGANKPSFRFYSIGFRVACVPSSTASTKIAASPPVDSSEDVEPAAVSSPPIPEPTGDGPAPAAAPFDAADAKVHQGKWARHLGERVEVTNSLGMKLRVIPPGTFMMGSEDGKTDEKPVHQVTLTKPILLGVYEVTQSEYQQVMGVNPSGFKGLRNPVTNLSWDDANEFCRRLSLLPREKRTGRVYRLPTEAEWEFACRAGTMTTYNFGDNESSLSRHAWSKDNSGRKTHSVGSKIANPFGLHDMHGNVWEWCNDWHGSYPSGSVTDPVGLKPGSNRVLRGGCWNDAAEVCRSALRLGVKPSFRSNGSGFRVACVPSSTAARDGTPLPATTSKESESTLPKAPAKIVGQWKYANIQANFSAEIDAKKNGLVIWKDLTNNVTVRKYWSRIDDDSFLISDKRGEQGQRGWVIVNFQPNSAFAVCDSWSPGKAAAALWPAAPKSRNFGNANSPIIGSWVYRLKRGNVFAQVDAQADGTAYWVDMNGVMGSKHWTPMGGNTYLISDESGIKGEKGWHVVHFPGRNGILECDDWNAGKATATLQWVRRP